MHLLGCASYIHHDQYDMLFMSFLDKFVRNGEVSYALVSMLVYSCSDNYFLKEMLKLTPLMS